MILMLNSSEPLKKVALIETGRVPFGVSVLFRVLFLCLFGCEDFWDSSLPSYFPLRPNMCTYFPVCVSA